MDQLVGDTQLKAVVTPAKKTHAQHHAHRQRTVQVRGAAFESTPAA